MNPHLLVLVLVVVLGFAGSFEDENENEEEDERASGCKLAPLGESPLGLDMVVRPLITRGTMA